MADDLIEPTEAEVQRARGLIADLRRFPDHDQQVRLASLYIAIARAHGEGGRESALIFDHTVRSPPPDALSDLVQRFSAALLKKLRDAEQKYGYHDNWKRAGWGSKLRTLIREHVEKGDPRDVAAYCAFAWHHRWSLAGPKDAPPPDAREEVHMVFDGPPGHEAGRFVEVEDASGKSIRLGEWHQRPDGLWELVFLARLGGST